MHLRRPLPWLSAVALLAAACADSGPAAPTRSADLSEDTPLSAVLPDLAPEPGTAGTDRYVPALERILRRAVRVVGEKQGNEVAGKVVAEARALADSVRLAKQAGDTSAVKESMQRLEAFEARIGLRVFGVGLLWHVYRDAAGRLETLPARLNEASEAGRNVDRLAQGARLVRRLLAAAREEAANGRPVAALVHAGDALDLVIWVDAALPSRRVGPGAGLLPPDGAGPTRPPW